MKTIIDQQIAVSDIVRFDVTGRYYNSHKRFKMSFGSLLQACSINLWNGSVWAVQSNGSRKLIKRVLN